MLLAITEGTYIIIISSIATLILGFVGAFFTLKGKKLDAGQWITDELREDAELKRTQLFETEKEFLEYKEITQTEIIMLKHAVAELKLRERELIGYIKLIQNELGTLKDLYMVQLGSTPNVRFDQINQEILDREDYDEIGKIFKYGTNDTQNPYSKDSGQ